VVYPVRLNPKPACRQAGPKHETCLPQAGPKQARMTEAQMTKTSEGSSPGGLFGAFGHLNFEFV
jgi:hypothetical protein